MPDIILDDLSVGSVMESFTIPEELPPDQPPPDPSTIKVGEKTAAQLLAEAEALKEALKTSEAARQAQEAALRAGNSARQPAPPPATPEPPELSPTEAYAQFEKMYSETPEKAVAALQNYHNQQLEKTLAKRSAEMFSMMATNAEHEARRQFSDEFEVLGDEIRHFASQMNAQQLASAQGWAELVAYVRGRPGNFEKMMEKRTAKRAAEEAVRNAPPPGFSPTTRFSAPAPRAGSTTEDTPFDDPVTETIFQRLKRDGVVSSRAEYLKWS